MNLEVLRKVGLSEGEVKVYNALLEIGVTSTNKIHEKVGIDRRNIYDILNKLIERGLVSYIEANDKRVFRLASPERIVSYIEEKRAMLEQTKKEIEKILPAIKEIASEKKEETFAQIFKGAEGLKAVWDDMLNYDCIYWMGSGNYVPNRFPAFWKDWDRRRRKKKVKSLHLFRYEKREETDKKIFPTSRFLPKEFSGNPTVTVIYGNKVTQMLLGETITVFVIESSELAENYKLYHKFLWDNVAKQ